ATYDQKLNDAENKIRNYKKLSEEDKRLADENNQKLMATEHEKRQLKDENKQLRGEVEKALFECVQQEKLHVQERENRLSLEAAKFQELAQAKGNYIILSN
ncbi:16996_t:CDS:2, partial [Funneliformis geosporum]